MPPARSRTLQFRVNDLEQLFTGAETWLQLTPGVLECTGSRVQLPGARVTELNLNCGMQISTRIERGRLAMLLIRPESGGHVLSGGKKYLDACALVVSGDELSFNVLGPASILWFEIDGRAGTRHRGGSYAPARYAFEPSARERWTLSTSGAQAMHGDGVEAELDHLARTLLQRGRSRSASGSEWSRATLVRTALELMWSSIEEPPTLRDICVAAKCSVRTLIYVFNATFGMSPMRYFKIQRLNVAHRRLQSAGSGARIFDIAADCGFWHLGHFGVDYKAFFGTTPRMTPRRSR
jgi:AraC-like DNA-binding protein